MTISTVVMPPPAKPPARRDRRPSRRADDAAGYKANRPGDHRAGEPAENAVYKALLRLRRAGG